VNHLKTLNSLGLQAAAFMCFYDMLDTKSCFIICWCNEKCGSLEIQRIEFRGVAKYAVLPHLYITYCYIYLVYNFIVTSDMGGNSSYSNPQWGRLASAFG